MGCVQSTNRKDSTTETTEVEAENIELSNQKKSCIFNAFKESITKEEGETPQPNGKVPENTVPFDYEEILFCELLYQILHPIRKDVAKEHQNSNLEILQEIININKNEVAKKIMEANERTEVEKRLNFKVLEANGFESSKGKGASCRVFLKKKPEVKIESQILRDTTSLFWNYTGSLPIANLEKDTMCVEVWTHLIRAAKTNKKEAKSAPKESKNFMKMFIKEDESKCSGSAEISLQNIPLEGKEEWVDLNKKKRKVHLHLSLGSTKDVQEACLEHRQLVRVLVRHELQKASAPFSWKGGFCERGEQLLTYHRVYTSMSETHAQLARWAGLCDHHEQQPFNFAVLENALKKLLDLQRKEEKCFDDQETKIFWDAKRTLIPNCVEFTRSIFKLSELGGNALQNQIASMLRMISQMLLVKAPTDVTTLSRNKSLNADADIQSNELKKLLKSAIKDCAREWAVTNFAEVKESPLSENKSIDKSLANKVIDVKLGNDIEMEEIIKILVLCNNQITNTKECITANSNYDSSFRCLGISFAKEITEVYDRKIHEVVKPIVVNACKKMQSTKKTNDNDDASSRESYKIIIELYCNLKSFSGLGDTYCPDQKLKCKEFHSWFGGGVKEQWLDIIFVKALNYIEGAIEKDIPESKTKYSSSAVDVLEILKMLENHVESLQSANEKSSSSLAMLGLVEKIAKCTEYYADRVTLKVSQAKNCDEANLCFAMNNIERVRCSGLEPMLKKLSPDIIFSCMDKISASAAECQEILKALKRVVDAVQYTERKILDVAKILSKKIMVKFMEDEFLSPFGFMNKSVAILHFENAEQKLSEENYKKVISLCTKYIVKIFNQAIKAAKRSNKPPIYFANLQLSLIDFEDEFILEKKATCVGEVDTLKKTLAQLSVDPVHTFCLERLNSQDAIVSNDKKGQVKLAVQLKDTALKVKLLNACNLATNRKEAECNPYIKVRLHPKHNFSSANKAKTSVKSRAARESVDFEDVFDFQLEKNVNDVNKNVVHLMVMDHRRFGRDRMIGEMALPFEKVQFVASQSEEEPLEIEMPLLKLNDSPSGKINMDIQKILPRFRT